MNKRQHSSKAVFYLPALLTQTGCELCACLSFRHHTGYGLLRLCMSINLLFVSAADAATATAAAAAADLVPMHGAHCSL
jgi:hypothetical protein